MGQHVKSNNCSLHLKMDFIEGYVVSDLLDEVGYSLKTKANLNQVEICMMDEHAWFQMIDQNLIFNSCLKQFPQKKKKKLLETSWF